LGGGGGGILPSGTWRASVVSACSSAASMGTGASGLTPCALPGVQPAQPYRCRDHTAFIRLA